jgi:hypothetical protein
MSYKRVIPRDLFNEAKLLKCLGQLQLLIHDGVGIRWPLRFRHIKPDIGFIVEQQTSDGGIYCLNLPLFVGKQQIHVYSRCNSKDPYPLCFDKGSYVEGEVLTDEGKLTQEFTEWLDKVVKLLNITAQDLQQEEEE